MANRENGYMLKTGRNVLTGRSYDIYQVSKQAKGRPITDVGMYRVKLYAPTQYNDGYINALVKSELFLTLEGAKSYAYDFMSY